MQWRGLCNIVTRGAFLERLAILSPLTFSTQFDRFGLFFN